MKYKKGDECLLRQDLFDIGYSFYGVGKIEKYSGKTVTIDNLIFNGYTVIEEGDNGQYLTDAMILMSKQEFDDMYVGKNKVVHCPTEAGSKEFSDIAAAFGYKRNIGKTFDSAWYVEKENTCYGLYDGHFCRKAWYEGVGDQIIKYKGEKEMTKSDLKIGMVVKTRHGGFTILDQETINYKRGDMTSRVSARDDIMEVLEPIWVREETKEMTVEQIGKKLGYRVKVIEG